MADFHTVFYALGSPPLACYKAARRKDDEMTGMSGTSHG